MKTFVALSAFAALTTAAPFFPTGTAPPPPMFPHGSGMPPLPTGSGWFPGMVNGTHPHHHHHHPSGSGHMPPPPSGTAPVSPPGGTAPVKREVQSGGLSAFSPPSFSMPTGGFGGGSGFAQPTGFGSGSPFGSGSLPSFSLPTGGFGSGVAAPTGLSELRHKGAHGVAAPSGMPGSASFSMPSGMAAPTGAAPSGSLPSITMTAGTVPTGMKQDRGYAGAIEAGR